jgi:hypothetical protein
MADFFSIEAILLSIYLLMLFWNVKSKKACLVSAVVSVVLIASAVFLPIVLHYPYNQMLVWLPVTTVIAIWTMVACAVIVTVTYIYFGMDLGDGVCGP